MAITFLQTHADVSIYYVVKNFVLVCPFVRQINQHLKGVSNNPSLPLEKHFYAVGPFVLCCSFSHFFSECFLGKHFGSIRALLLLQER